MDNLLFQAFQAVGRLALGPGDQHVLGVGRPQQPPAVGRVDAHPVQGEDVGTLGGQAGGDFLDHREFPDFVDLEPRLRRVHGGGQPTAQSRQRLVAAAEQVE